MIYNFHKVKETNVGDSKSPVSLYFDLGDCETIDICKVQNTDLNRADYIVVGGGGLLYFQESMKYLCSAKPCPLIAWGFGVNDHSSKSIEYPSWMEQFDLIGVRDWQSQYDWVPCPSCMSSKFDLNYEASVDIGVYEHLDRPIDLPFPKMSNDAEFSEVISFLGSCETVLTNTYHGVYWSTLLGKKVIAFPFSSRFYGFKHPPELRTIDDWEDAVPRSYEEALDECRQANLKYMEMVKQLILQKRIVFF